MEIIARPHVVFVRIITLRGKRGNKARMPAHRQNPIHLQTNSSNAWFMDLKKSWESTDIYRRSRTKLRHHL